MHMKSNNRFGTINTRVVEHLIYIYWSYNIPIGIVYSPVQASRAARTCHHTLPIPPTRHPSTHPPDGAHFRVPLPPSIRRLFQSRVSAVLEDKKPHRAKKEVDQS